MSKLSNLNRKTRLLQHVSLLNKSTKSIKYTSISIKTRTVPINLGVECNSYRDCYLL